MKVLWVFLAFFYFCFSSNAQMQDEGTTSTSTSETEIQGDLEVTTTTTTTTTIENKTTGNILSSGDTGIVSSRYEGDMDLDWGGIGSASMVTCPIQLGGSGKCAKGTSNTLTTFQQNIDISQFHINDGGSLRWDMEAWHSTPQTTTYFEVKGYNENQLLWTMRENSWNNSTCASNGCGIGINYGNNYDFSGALDKIFVAVGGAKNYYFDNAGIILNYNYITTQITEEIFYQIIQTEIDTTATNILNTPVVTTNVVNPEPIAPEIPEIAVMTVDLPSVDLTTTVAPIEIQAIDDAGFTPTLNLGEPVATVETITEEIQEVMIVEIAQPEPEPIKVESQPEPEIVINTPEEPVNDDIEQPINAPTEPVEEVEDSKPAPETASNDEPIEEVKEEPKEVVEEQPELEPQKKEVAENEPKEEPEEVKEEVKEEPKQEEEVKEAKAEDKPTKKQEAKQEKAKEIMQSFDSQYDAVAQLTTLALVNALGADITTYQQVPTQVQPTWYESKEIYANTILQDPLGAYYGVRDSLVFEQMIGAQYNE